jgi:hypothetical protein
MKPRNASFAYIVACASFAAASKELHPDRYFGKDLGHFREKLAKIFNRITEATQELQKAHKAKK